MGLCGSYALIIAHGVCLSGLFCLANITYERFVKVTKFDTFALNFALISTIGISLETMLAGSRNQDSHKLLLTH